MCLPHLLRIFTVFLTSMSWGLGLWGQTRKPLGRVRLSISRVLVGLSMMHAPTPVMRVKIKAHTTSRTSRQFIHQYINTSIHPYIHTSIRQYVNTSIHQYINTSIHQYISTSAHQHISTSTHQHINTSTHQHINTSTHQHINASTHQQSINPSIHPGHFASNPPVASTA